jgi:hypothetical protein
MTAHTSAVRNRQCAIGSQIAAEAGYDISGEIGRPATMQPTPTDQEMENATCVLTCCWVETSVWDTEGPSIGGF